MYKRQVLLLVIFEWVFEKVSDTVAIFTMRKQKIVADSITEVKKHSFDYEESN